MLLSLYTTFAFWFFNISYILVAFIPFCLASLIHPSWGRLFAIGWARAVIWGMFLPVKIIGKENIPSGPIIIASNHTSMLDIHLTLGFFPKKFHFLMKEELFKIPLFGTACTILGFFPINRTNPKRAMETMRIVAEKVKNGESVLIYPEGTRNKLSEKMLPFKSGIARVAAMAQVPVLPIIVRGCREACPSAKKLCHWHPLKIIIGKPMNPPINENKENLEKFTNELRNKMEALFLK